MFLVRRLLLAGLCAVVPVTVLAAEGSAQEAIKGSAQFETVPILPKYEQALCGYIERSSSQGIDAIAKKYSDYTFYDIAMSADCKGATAIRYAFRVMSQDAYRHMFDNLEVDPNGLDENGNTVRDYIEMQILRLSRVPDKEDVVEKYKEYLAEIIDSFGGKNSQKWLSENPKAGKIDPKN